MKQAFQFHDEITKSTLKWQRACFVFHSIAMCALRLWQKCNQVYHFVWFSKIFSYWKLFLFRMLFSCLFTLNCVVLCHFRVERQSQILWNWLVGTCSSLNFNNIPITKWRRIELKQFVVYVSSKFGDMAHTHIYSHRLISPEPQSHATIKNQI